jgi:hypothetical protein
MNTPTPEQIAKLPKWAQEYTHDLERRVETSERVLKDYKDSQTPSEFYYDDYHCVGQGSPQFIRRFIQTNQMTVTRDGVQLTILLRQDDPGIQLSFCSVNRLVSQVAMVPTSFNQIRILSKDKLR